jgi:glyoxylase-like metal-dependent hydrolase (beta-lactamase superfamily II)
VAPGERWGIVGRNGTGKTTLFRLMTGAKGWDSTPKRPGDRSAESAKEADLPEITLLRPGFWLVETDLEDFQLRGAVLVGAERAVVWDTLARPRDMAGVAELTSGLPLSVVYSHGDWDHVWGTAGLARPWDDILAHLSCAERFLKEIPGTLKEKQSESPGVYDGVRLLPPTRTFRATLTMELGGVTLELHHLPGHTPDSVVGFLPEWGILLAGDAVETPLPFLNPGSPIEPWAESLEDWSERLEKAEEPSIVIPSHGQIGGPELLRENAGYLRKLLAGRDPGIREGLNPFYRETHASNQAVARRK